MKIYRIFIAIILSLLFAGCSGEKKVEKKTEPSTKEVSQPKSPEDAAIRASLSELFDRIKEGDKTVLYENELDYYKDTVSLSAYMDLKKVKDYKYDTLKGIEIDSTSIMGDSAWAYVKIIYQSAEGVEHPHPYRLTVYNFNGNWVKPYQSRWADEKYYLEQKRIYDSVTAGQ